MAPTSADHVAVLTGHVAPTPGTYSGRPNGSRSACFSTMAKAAGNSDSLDLQPPRPPPTLPYSTYSGLLTDRDRVPCKSHKHTSECLIECKSL